MNINYIRPTTLQEALDLLSAPNAIPLAGGTWVNTTEFRRGRSDESDLLLVDLQALGLNRIHKHGNNLGIGACATLQQILECPHSPASLKSAIKLESSLNSRNAATVAGSLISCGGRSAFATAMLALDAKLTFQPGDSETSLGNFLPLRENHSFGLLINQISIPLNVKLTFEYVARTPFDQPIVCAAVAQWTSGRTRLALGGHGKTPLLALDGTTSDDIKSAARNGYHEAADEWASAEYRADTAAILADRCLNQ